MSYKLMGALMLASAGAMLTVRWIGDRRAAIRLAKAMAATLERMAGRVRWKNMTLPRILGAACDDDISGEYFRNLCGALEGEKPLHIFWNQEFSALKDREIRDIMCRVDLRGDVGQVISSLQMGAEELRSYAAVLAAQQQQSERLVATVCGSITAILIMILI